MPGFEWDERKSLIAQLMADGELTDGEIAQRVGISRQGVSYYRKNPEFVARVDEIREEIRASLRQRKIAAVEHRLDRINRDWLKLQRVIDARAADPDHMKAPGGDTGLLVHKLKTVGSGPTAMVVDEYEVDTALLRELRDLERQAAQELGQWNLRPIPEDLSKLSDEELEAIARRKG